MPRPTEHPDWATAPSDPTDIVRPPLGRINDGWNPAEKPPAQFWNWWQNLVGQWIRWLEESLLAAQDELTTRINALSGFATLLASRIGNIEQRIQSDEWTYPAPKTRTVILLPTMDALGWNYVVETNLGNEFLARLSTSAAVRFPVPLPIPTGGRLLRVRALVRPVVARTFASRMNLTVYSSAFGFSAPLGPALGSAVRAGPVFDDGTTALQVIDSGAIAPPPANAPNRVHYAFVAPGLSTAGVGDRVYAIEVIFSDPGPRNDAS